MLCKQMLPIMRVGCAFSLLKIVLKKQWKKTLYQTFQLLLPSCPLTNDETLRVPSRNKKAATES